MNKPYEKLTLEIIRFGAEDIITASDEADDTPSGGNAGGGGYNADDTASSGTSGTFYYGPKDVRDESHTLTRDPDSDYIGEHFQWPGYTDESGNIWWLIDGNYVLATNPENFV